MNPGDEQTTIWADGTVFRTDWRGVTRRLSDTIPAGRVHEKVAREYFRKKEVGIYGAVELEAEVEL